MCSVGRCWSSLAPAAPYPDNLGEHRAAAYPGAVCIASAWCHSLGRLTRHVAVGRPAASCQFGAEGSCDRGQHLVRGHHGPEGVASLGGPGGGSRGW